MFRSGITLMTTVVVPRDRNAVFLADLTAEDLLVFEDDRPRPVVSLVPRRRGARGQPARHADATAGGSGPPAAASAPPGR